MVREINQIVWMQAKLRVYTSQEFAVSVNLHEMDIMKTTPISVKSRLQTAGKTEGKMQLADQRWNADHRLFNNISIVLFPF